MGTLITTVPLRSPQLEPGIYTVYHGAEGSPRTEFHFRSNGDAAQHTGKLVARLPVPGEPEWKPDYVGAGVSVVGENGRTVATFVFGVPTTGDRHVVFSLRVELDEPADAEHPWRVPPSTR